MGPGPAWSQEGSRVGESAQVKEAPSFPSGLGASREKLAGNRRGAGDQCPLREELSPAAWAATGSQWEVAGMSQGGYTSLSLIAYEAREAFRAEAVEGGFSVLVQQAGPTMQALAGVTEVTCNNSSESGTSRSLSKYLGGQLPCMSWAPETEKSDAV